MVGVPTFTSYATGAVTIKSQENVALMFRFSPSDVTVVFRVGKKFVKNFCKVLVQTIDK